MKFVVVHLLWLYGDFLGRLAPQLTARQAARSSEVAGRHVASLVRFLKREVDRVIVLTDSSYSFRNALCEEHDERQIPWPQEAWEGYHLGV